MIIYKDLVSGDEVISDSYDIKEVDDVVFEVDCQMINVGGENFDVGGNPSAGGEDEEGVEDTSVKVNNVVHSFRLQYLGDEDSRTPLFTSKKEFTGSFKAYLKSVVAKLKDQGKSDEEIKTFQTKVQNYFTKVIAPNFKDYEFYTGESNNAEGLLLLLNYREDGTTPYFTIWKGGLSEMKV